MSKVARLLNARTDIRIEAPWLHSPHLGYCCRHTWWCESLFGYGTPPSGTNQGLHSNDGSLAPHERLPEILVVPREKTPTGAAARGNP